MPPPSLREFEICRGRGGQYNHTKRREIVKQVKKVYKLKMNVGGGNKDPNTKFAYAPQIANHYKDDKVAILDVVLAEVKYVEVS